MPEKFFGRRKGKKLRAGRLALLENLLPFIQIPVPKDARDESEIKEVLPCIKEGTLFPFKPEEIWLEVGFGGGEHLAQLALKYPKVGFIGAEVFVNGVASLLAHLNTSSVKENEQEKSGLDGAPLQTESKDRTAQNQTIENLLAPERADNVRIFYEDIRLLFPYLPDGMFSKIFVLYPDPWPKTRHEKRRFIGSGNLPTLARLLKENGQLIIATDVDIYADWTLQEVAKFPVFKEVESNHLLAPEDWVTTRYEQKALAAGRIPRYFVFEKRS
jgi:tRNA (guanine-N7-)-methyltransferase